MQETKKETEADAASNTTVVIDDLELHVPSAWTICGNRMFSDDTPVIAVDINDFYYRMEYICKMIAPILKI